MSEEILMEMPEYWSLEKVFSFAKVYKSEVVFNNAKAYLLIGTMGE